MSSDNRMVCVKLLSTKEVQRIRRPEADKLVAERKANYVPKHVWCASRPKTETKAELAEKQSEKVAERKKNKPKK